MKLFLTIASLIFVSSLSYAEEAQQGVVDRREDRQEKRIDQGVQSGALNEHEQRMLERRQKRIQKAEDKALADDGKLDKKEFRHIEKMQNQANREIRRKKHNRH